MPSRTGTCRDDARANAPLAAPVIHRYVARGAALELLRRREGEILLAGAAGTGKSRGCLEKLFAAMLKYSGSKGLIVRKVRASLASTALDTWRRYVIVEALALGAVRFYGGSNEEPPQYIFPNGSRVMIGGMDDPLKIMSSDYDMAYVQEAVELKPDDWGAITTRLRNGVMPYQQLIADCNPDAPTHWLLQRCNSGRAVMLESRHEDNPVYFNEDGSKTERGREYIARLDNLVGVQKQRLRYGRWVSAEGVIYEDYDSAIHLVDRFVIPDSWDRYWAVDFGYTNPFVCQWWARDPDGRLFLYREIYHTKRTTDVHARDILDQVRRAKIDNPKTDRDYEWIEPRPTSVVCDHDAEGRAVLERELGLSTVNAHKAVKEGIEAVQIRQKLAGDSRPRWFIMKGSLVERDAALEEARKPCCTAEEVTSYVWKDSVAKEEPVKENDHGMDAARYVAAHLDLQGKPRVRWFDMSGSGRSF